MIGQLQPEELRPQDLVSEPKSKDKQLLPDVERNHSSPADVDDRPFASPPPPISIDTSEICTALISNVEYLTNAQVDAVWKAIARRICSDSLGLHNWPDSELKHIIKEAKYELNARHHPEYFNKSVVDRSRIQLTKDAHKAQMIDWDEEADDDLTLGVPESDEEIL